MIKKEYIREIKNRDFFKIVNHYHDYDDISTDLLIGSWPSDEVFLSIIIPVYNHPIDFIIRAIESAENQDVDFDYRILVIDDFVREGEDNGVESYILNHPNEHLLYYKNQKNLGVFANWNRGILLSRSKWITILHTDDFLKPNYLKNMAKIVNEHAYIDQIACPYEILDYTKGNVDIEKAMLPYRGEAILRKVDYREYMYGMYTSVKGAMYKRQSLLNIGGFMNQGDGLGLDDYPLMMRYAYYYNTYLVDAVLYMDSWGYNDSLNVSHWYPELIANYYMWRCMEKKRFGIIKWAYSVKDKYNLTKRAKEYEDGTSWVGKKIDINYEELYSICGVQNPTIPWLISYIARGIVRLDQAYIKNRQKKEIINIE